MGLPSDALQKVPTNDEGQIAIDLLEEKLIEWLEENNNIKEKKPTKSKKETSTKDKSKNESSKKPKS